MSTEILTLIILIASFVGSFVNAAFATGGAFLMLAISASVLPVSAIVPLHTAFMFGSLLARCYYFWRDIYWAIATPFVLGCIIGTTVGAKLYLDLPEFVIALVLGLLMLGSTWLPKFKWTVPMKHPFFVVGIFHSLLSTMFAYGALLHPLILRTELNKTQITATLAGSLLMMGILKFVGYVSFGFNYLDYIPLIVAATLAGFAGTWVGKRVSHHISETLFRQVFRIIMTVFAARLLFRAWSLA